MYRDTTNVEPEMYDYTSNTVWIIHTELRCTVNHTSDTSNNWSQCNSNEKLKEKYGNCTRKTFDRFTTKDNYTWNITHNTERTAV